ncbi:MAG: hypothetical protein FWB78_01320, partial [Treponema sp.]|nr:hypothetical protein [Treponema sp.]
MKRFYLRTVAFCLLFWSVLGCSLDGETGIPLPQYSPELLSVEVVSGTKIDFEFSTPVRRVQISFEPSLEIAAIEEGSTVRVRLEQGLEPGKRVVADIRAEDVHGNTFNESVPLEKALEMEEPPASPPVDDTVGNSAPQLLINELRTESSATRSEFIEFRMLTAGNLDGVRVFIYRSGGGRTPIIFEFPGTEVMADEY